MVICTGCGLARNLLDYEYEEAYTDEAGIYHALNEEECDEWLGRAGPLEGIVSRFADSPGEMLDFGCNAGYLMHIFQEKGWNDRGVDLHPAVIKDAQSRGFTATCTRLEDAGYADNSFDLVTMTHILEHLPELEIPFAEVRRILKPGGLLLIAVPNFGARLELFFYEGALAGFCSLAACLVFQRTYTLHGRFPLRFPESLCKLALPALLAQGKSNRSTPEGGIGYLGTING